MIYVLHIYQNRNCVRVGLFWRHGRCCCDCNLRPSWRHGFCQLSVFSIFLEVLLFFVSAYGWIISSSWEQFIDFMIKDCRVRRSDKSLFKIEHSILFKKNIDRPELWGNSSQEFAGETGVNYVISPFTRCLLDLSLATDRIW